MDIPYATLKRWLGRNRIAGSGEALGERGFT